MKEMHDMRMFCLTLLSSVLFVSTMPTSGQQQNSPPSAEPGQSYPPGFTKEQMRRADASIIRPAPVKRLRKRPDEVYQKELEEKRRVSDQDRLDYASFLKTDDSGIFKLFPDTGCIKKIVLSVDDDCWAAVEESSHYTFRMGTYGRAGDIGYIKDSFTSKDFFSRAIIVSLGDIPIESVIMNHPAVASLAAFKSPSAPAEAESFFNRFADGVDAGGYRFASSLTAAASRTYVIRKIDFNMAGRDVKYTFSRKGESSDVGMSLQQMLGFKERNDTIYVFRVIRNDSDGAATIVWRQLSRKGSPSIIFKKGDKYPDFGEWTMPS